MTELVRLTPRSRVGYIVNAATGCWEWQGKLRGGYGIVWDDDTKTTKSAHRIVYEKHRDAVPEGLDLDHLCRNRRCVNPEHLQPVSRFVNLTRGANTKLTWEIVREIRRRYIAGDITHRDLAKEFSISNRQCSQITMGRSWPDPEYEPPTTTRRHGIARGGRK